MSAGRIARRALPGLIGLALVFAIWETIGRICQATQTIATVPPITKVLSSIIDDGWEYYGPNVGATAWVAARGFLWGTGIAVAMAFLVLLVPFLERVIMQIGVTSYCLPIVAIGSILLLKYDIDTVKVMVAVLFVLFSTLVNTLVGLRSADPTSLDVVRAYGGGRIQGLRRVRIKASLPSFFACLQVAGPAAILGAMLGEYFGADRGLGVGIIRSQQQLQVHRTFAIALVATAIGAVAYGGAALLARFATPWAPKAGS